MDLSFPTKTQYMTHFSPVFTDEPPDPNLLTTPVPPHEPVVYPWHPDQGDGTYKNPVICADYSDPDVCRVGDDFYLTASSFSCVPGLSVLHSKDLVNWKILGHAFGRYPIADFDIPRHACGVWAPAIRFHNGYFYIFFGDPDHGIFMARSKNPAGPAPAWEPVHRLRAARGWIDCCPFWDDDGSAYLVHAFSRSRAGFRNVLHLHKMSPDGMELLDDGQLIIAGLPTYSVVEGPKMYKRNGFYYILAPGGGVSHGYQIAFRSKSIYGPYESRIVMDRGSTPVNGPHQGAFIDTPDGKESWFLHFQELLPYGRVSHLQPMQWINDWPVIGEDRAHTGRGEPVLRHKKPQIPTAQPDQIPQTSDNFDGPALAPQWQWWANPKAEWYSLSERPGHLRLRPVALPESTLLYNRPNLILQKFPAEVFTATTKLDASALHADETAGLTLAGKTMSAIHVQKTASTSLTLTRSDYNFADQASTTDAISASATVPATTVYLRLSVAAQGICTLSYSLDGKNFTPLGGPVTAINAMWIGAKVGLFCNAPPNSQPKGHADFDYLLFEP